MKTMPAPIETAFFSQRLYSVDVDFPERIHSQDAKVAAVLLPLVSIEEEYHVIYTKRTETVLSHKGQISFPGGMAEVQDIDPCRTALRETEEELGIPAASIKLVGRLEQVQTFTNLIIYPFVGIVDWPVPLILSTEEVSKIILIPLHWLMEPEHSIEKEYNGHQNVVFFQPYEGEVLWGITASMTKKFISMLEK